MADYIKPTSDIFTHYLLGSVHNGDLLLSFINAVMADAGSPIVQDVTILNPFNPATYETDKPSILDVKATDDSGTIYKIEIQSTGNAEFIHRSLYYWARTYSAQLEIGEKYGLLHPVICINIVDFLLIEKSPRVHTLFFAVEKDDRNLKLTDHFEIHYIELTKMKKPGQAMKKELADWLQFLTKEGKEEESMKAVLESVMEKSKAIRRAHEEYQKFAADEQLRYLYEGQLKWERDQNTLLDQQMQKGIQKGKQEGEHLKALETARNLLSMGLSIDVIIRATGLTESQLRENKII